GGWFGRGGASGARGSDSASWLGAPRQGVAGARAGATAVGGGGAWASVRRYLSAERNEDVCVERKRRRIVRCICEDRSGSGRQGRYGVLGRAGIYGLQDRAARGQDGAAELADGRDFVERLRSASGEPAGRRRAGFENCVERVGRRADWDWGPGGWIGAGGLGRVREVC